jgi:hypothetical protein
MNDKLSPLLAFGNLSWNDDFLTIHNFMIFIRQFFKIN